MDGLDFISERAKTVIHAALNGAIPIDADIGSLLAEAWAAKDRYGALDIEVAAFEESVRRRAVLGASDVLSVASELNGEYKTKVVQRDAAQDAMYSVYDSAIVATIQRRGLIAALPIIKDAYGVDDAMAAALLHIEREEK